MSPILAPKCWCDDDLTQAAETTAPEGAPATPKSGTAVLALGLILAGAAFLAYRRYKSAPAPVSAARRRSSH